MRSFPMCSTSRSPRTRSTAWPRSSSGSAIKLTTRIFRAPGSRERTLVEMGMRSLLTGEPLLTFPCPREAREVRPVLPVPVHYGTNARKARRLPRFSQIVSLAKRHFGRRARSASHSVVRISDRDRAFSANDKAMSGIPDRKTPCQFPPMFTISSGAIPAPRDCGRLHPILAERKPPARQPGLA